MCNTLQHMLWQDRKVLIFLPNTNELQRFVLSGAFDPLSEEYDLHFVVPPDAADRMRGAAPDYLRADNTYELAVPPERFAEWKLRFETACHLYADRSASFALRVGKYRGISSARGKLRYATLKTFETAKKFARTYPRRMPISRVIRGLQRRLAANPKPSLERKSSPPRDTSAKSGKHSHLRNLSVFEPMLELIEQVNPVFCVIPTSLLDIYCNDLMLCCAKKKVPVIALQSGWDNLSSKGIVHRKPTYTGVWGPQSQEHAVLIQGIDSTTITCLGAPHYESLKMSSAHDIAAFRSSLGVSAGENLILFGGSFRQFDETALLAKLDRTIGSGALGKLKILYRPHPWRADRMSEDSFFSREWKHIIFDPDMTERYVRAKQQKGYLKSATPMYSMDYLALLLSSVEGVISPMSTLLVESMIMGRRTMAVAFGDGKHAYNPSVSAKMTHFQELRKSQALEWCDDEGQFIAQVGRLLTSPENRSESNVAQALLAQIVTSQPDTYGKRLVHFARTIVEPEVRRKVHARVMKDRKSISDAYSANFIAARYCNLDEEAPEIPGYWMHGWIAPYHNQHSAFIALHKKPGQGKGYNYLPQIEEEKTSVPQWVSRQDQCDFLKAKGYKHVRAIGLPFAYLPDVPTERIPGSLLVMPPHGQRCRGADDQVAQEYAAAIAKIRHEFSEVWLCVNVGDFINRQWVDSFRDHGISYFVGANHSDEETLLRFKRILSSFEYVTTNGYGSHIVYAAYCGAKVSLFGPFAEYPRTHLARVHAVKMFPDLLEVAHARFTEQTLREHYGELFTHPKDAIERRSWAAHEIGADIRLPPKELARLFGWSTQQSAHDGPSVRAHASPSRTTSGSLIAT
jgi:hypothetical protein